MRVRPKNCGMFHAVGFDIIIRLHFNQVWDCEEKTNGDYQIERDNVSIKIPKETLDKLFRRV